MKMTTVTIDMADCDVVFRPPHRHIFLGSVDVKERWIDTHRDDVTYEFNRGSLVVTAPRDYLAKKGLPV